MTLQEIQRELNEGRAVVVNPPWIAVTLLDAVENLPEGAAWGCWLLVDRLSLPAQSILVSPSWRGHES